MRTIIRTFSVSKNGEIIEHGKLPLETHHTPKWLEVYTETLTELLGQKVYITIEDRK